MFEEQRQIVSFYIPFDVALLFIAIGVVAAAVAIWGYLTGGSKGERILRIASAALCGLGLFVSGYIAYKNLIVVEPMQCGNGGGCIIVEKSKYSRPFWGIHLSIWGLIGYSAILAATVWRGDNARLAAFGLSVFGFAASLVLRYLELWEIGAACQWCWASAVMMTMLMVVNSLRLIGSYGRDDFDGDYLGDEDDEAGPSPSGAAAESPAGS